MDLRKTAFKHVGIFPEQISNWEFIEQQLRSGGKEKNVLNLFAYSGGASLAAKLAGASVTHVDSIPQVVQWGKHNMELSGLKDIRWLVDDAMKFLEKEVRRGNKYDGLIMDPPSWGRGPKGERWKIEGQLEPLLELSRKVLKDPYFFVMSTYSGLPDTVVFGKTRKVGIRDNLRCEPTQIESESGQILTLGNTTISYK